MKKSFAYLAAVLLLLLCLSGCGNSNMDNTRVSPVPTAMPSASPYASPNVNDGVVKDRDGIIEDRDTGGAYDDNNGILDGDRNGTGILDDNVTGNGITNNGNHVGGTVSPSPSATTKPNTNQ